MNTPLDTPISSQEALQRTRGNSSDADALQRAQDIVGKTRLIGNYLYIEDAPERHEKLDRLLLELLAADYPDLVEFIQKLRLWYG